MVRALVILRYLKTDTIFDVVGGGGSIACETDTIQNVTDVNPLTWIADSKNPNGNDATGFRLLDDANGLAVFDSNVAGGWGNRTTSRDFAPALGLSFENYPGTIPARPFNITAKVYVGEGSSIAALANLRQVNFCLIEYMDGTDESVAATSDASYIATATIPDNGKALKAAKFYYYVTGQDRDNNATVIESIFLDGTQVKGVPGTTLTFPIIKRFRLFCY